MGYRVTIDGRVLTEIETLNLLQAVKEKEKEKEINTREQLEEYMKSYTYEEVEEPTGTRIRLVNKNRNGIQYEIKKR